MYKCLPIHLLFITEGMADGKNWRNESNGHVFPCVQSSVNHTSKTVPVKYYCLDKTLPDRYTCLLPFSDAHRWIEKRKHESTCRKFSCFIYFRSALHQKNASLWSTDVSDRHYLTGLVHLFNLNTDGHLKEVVKYFPKRLHISNFHLLNCREALPFIKNEVSTE